MFTLLVLAGTSFNVRLNARWEILWRVQYDFFGTLRLIYDLMDIYALSYTILARWHPESISVHIARHAISVHIARHVTRCRPMSVEETLQSYNNSIDSPGFVRFFVPYMLPRKRWMLLVSMINARRCVRVRIRVRVWCEVNVHLYSIFIAFLRAFSVVLN